MKLQQHNSYMTLKPLTFIKKSFAVDCYCVQFDSYYLWNTFLSKNPVSFFNISFPISVCVHIDYDHKNDSKP